MACRWCSRIQPARSTPGRRSTRRSPKGSGSTASATARRRRSRKRSAVSGLRPPERFFTRYPYEVSGGQRQRVVIAGAMALDPWLIVADEPVSALDASVRGEILALMLGLVREKGVTILAVTHDLGLAWNIADRIAVMYLGRIVEIGTTEEMLSHAAPPVHEGAALGRPGARADGAADPRRRGAGSAADPRGLPVPPPLPARRLRGGRAARNPRACVEPRTRRSRRSRGHGRGSARRVPRGRPRPATATTL